jgi:hypothetical protein
MPSRKRGQEFFRQTPRTHAATTGHQATPARAGEAAVSTAMPMDPSNEFEGQSNEMPQGDIQ